MASAQVVSQPLLMATIDFGTTFSGYAFQTVANLKENILNIHGYNWDLQNGVLKTPTCVLFDPAQNFNSFGRDAEDKYTELAQQNDHANWYYFRRFKLDLYKCQDIPRNFMLKDVKGKRLPAMKVISESIEYMREHLMRELKRVRQGHPVIRQSEIRWIVTVPATWSNAAKQFMREAAEKGGMPSSRLMLVLEPEAAFTFCYQTNKERLLFAEKSMQCGFLPGTKCLILDAGGWFIDTLFHTNYSTRGSERFIYQTTVYGQLWKLWWYKSRPCLREFLGKSALQKFRNDDKAGYLDLQREFEKKEKGIHPNQSSKVTIKVPMSLADAFNNVSREDVQLSGNRLRLASKIVVDLIAKPCAYIVSRLKTIFDDPKVKGTEIILMVGGFSASSVLQYAVEKVFPTKTIIIPNNAEYAVLMGAVQFEVNPTITSCLTCIATHGISTTSPFEEGVDPEDKKFINDDGDVMCRGRFKKLVEIGQNIFKFEKFEEQIISPVSSEQQSVAIQFFNSLNKNPRYTDESGCFSRGTIDIKFPDPKQGVSRDVGVTLYVSGTGFEVEVIAKHTGEILPCFLDRFKHKKLLIQKSIIN